MSYLQDLELLFAPPVEANDTLDTSALTKFDEVLSTVFYPTQVKTAREIISKFSTTQLVLLLAQMQSGKTGAFLCTACAMVYFGVVDNVIIFTGVPDTDLYLQLEGSVMRAVEHFNRVMECDITGKVVAKKSSKLPSMSIQPKTLVVWDESHYAQDVNNRPYQMFQNNRLLVDGTTRTNDLWKNKECYLLTVSATPFSEYIDCRDNTIYSEITKEIVVMQPGLNYHGVGYFHNNNMITPSWNIKSSDGQRKFVNLLRSAKRDGNPKYGILRTRTDPGDIRLLAEYAGWKNFIFYDMKNRDDMPDGWDTLSNAPTEDTLVILKNLGRLGQVVPKQHLAFVFEYTTGGGKTDTVLQSLLGRMCGYYDDEPSIEIYVPNRLTEDNEIDDVEGIKKALEARIKRRTYELNEECQEHIDLIKDDDFAVASCKADYVSRIQEETARIKRDHEECLEYATASEIRRYVNMMTRRCDDVPRFAKNVVNSKLDQKKVGTVGYSTVPMEVHVNIDRDEGSEWTPIEECAMKMNRRNGCRTLTEADKMGVVRELINRIETTTDSFYDQVQRMEIINLLKDIVDGKYKASEIMNFGDLNSEKGKKSHYRTRMYESIHNKMPYIDIVKQKQWRINEESGRAKRIQLQICRHVEDTSSYGVQDFDHTHKLYFTGYTYEANQETKDAHKRSIIPATTRHEAFHHGNEQSLDATTTWVNVIKDEDAFIGMIDTIFPAGKRIRILPTQTIPQTVIHHLESLCLCNNGRFKVERINSKRTREDRALGSRVERYVAYFYQNTKLTFA